VNIDLGWMSVRASDPPRPQRRAPAATSLAMRAVLFHGI
jgi:hypothetical protein